jgi:hypothetical protein
MISGVLLFILLLLLLGAALALLWLNKGQDHFAERVAIELEKRSAERQLDYIALTTMRQMVDEARHLNKPSGPHSMG